MPQLHVPAQAAVIGDSAAILRFLYAKSLGTDKEEAAAFLRPTEETLAMERRIEDVLGNQSRRWVRMLGGKYRGNAGPLPATAHLYAVEWF